MTYIGRSLTRVSGLLPRVSFDCIHQCQRGAKMFVCNEAIPRLCRVYLCRLQTLLVKIFSKPVCICCVIRQNSWITYKLGLWN